MFRRWFQRKSKGAAAPAPQSTPFTAAPPAEPEAAHPAPGTSAPVGTPAPPSSASVEPTEAAYTLPAAPTAEERQRMVEEAAYFRSLERAPGEEDPARDWAEAEAEVSARLARD